MVIERLLRKSSFILFMVLLSFSCAQAMGQVEKGKEAPRTAPNFSLTDLEGKTTQLASLKGKNVILFFWTTWCPYCRRSIIDLEKKFPAIKAKGIVVLAIDIGETAQKVKSFLEKYPANFSVLIDTNGTTAETYDVIGIPTYVLIDSKGNIKSTDNSLPANYSEVFK